MGFAMLVHKVLQDLSRRPGSTWAKKALAGFRISLARRNFLFSRSRALMRSRSSLVTPSRNPVSTSSLPTHSCSVCGTQPILGAIDSTAAHRDGYSPGCSCTMRPAHSPTSGETDGIFCSSLHLLKGKRPLKFWGNSSSDSAVPICELAVANSVKNRRCRIWR
jgi:hypothetical protein